MFSSMCLRPRQTFSKVEYIYIYIYRERETTELYSRLVQSIQSYMHSSLFHFSSRLYVQVSFTYPVTFVYLFLQVSFDIHKIRSLITDICVICIGLFEIPRYICTSLFTLLSVSFHTDRFHLQVSLQMCKSLLTLSLLSVSFHTDTLHLQVSLNKYVSGDIFM